MLINYCHWRLLWSTDNQLGSVNRLLRCSGSIRIILIVILIDQSVSFGARLLLNGDAIAIRNINWLIVIYIYI